MMKPISVWKQELAGGTHTARLASLYCCSPEQTAAHAARYAAVLDGLEATFGAHTEAGLYSAPGRTEIGGNHTSQTSGKTCRQLGTGNFQFVRLHHLYRTNY